MEYVGHLFIGIGATSAFYTLRETYLYVYYFDGQRYEEVRSFHHQNLSTDLETAIEKAEEASQVLGLRLSVDMERLQEEMRAIQRATAEQMEARRRASEEEKARREAFIQARHQENVDRIAEGICPFGRNQGYAGHKFEKLPTAYLCWLANNLESFEPFSLVAMAAAYIQTEAPHLILPKADPKATVGEIGKRQTFNVTVVRQAAFERASFSGYGSETVYVTTMVTSDGVCLVCKSPSFRPEVADRLKIRATVKEHSEYKGQAQTIVQRVAVEA